MNEAIVDNCRMNVETALVSLRMDEDWHIRDRAMKDLEARYGAEVAKAIADAVVAIDDQDYREKAETLVSMEGLDVEDATELLIKIGEERAHRTAKMPIRSIMAMYRSGDAFLVDKAKQYVVLNYGKYVHDVIHRSYSTYADKYEDELFQCGCIGMLKAMRNYNPDFGAFTTYSKFFIMHEIADQVNFHHNDTTVYYNGVQKKINEAIAKLKADDTDPTVNRISIMTEIKPEIVKRELDYMEATRLRYLDADDEKEFPCAYETTPEFVAQQKEGMESLFRSIERLPEKTRKVVLLKYDGRRTNEEVARLVGITIGQVKTLYQKGLKTLRQDKLLCGAYSEYLSDAEREMLKYSMPRMETKKTTEKTLDALDLAMGGDGLASTGTEDPFAEALSVMSAL